MIFVAKKDAGIIPVVLSQILDSCVNGVTLSDPDLEDSPIVYANKAFEMMTGYAQDDIVGRNCRFLQGADREQPARYELRSAIASGQAIEVTLRNYRKDGELFHNRLNVRPLFDTAGKVLYFLGVQYDISLQVKAEQEIARLSKALAT